MTDNTYNGWTNWETWHTALVIDNDEPMSRQSWALACRCAAIKLGQVKGKVYDQTVATKAFRRQFSKAWTETKRFAQESWPGAPLDPVNWDEIAANAIDEAVNEFKETQ